MRSIITTLGSALAICALVACGAPQQPAEEAAEPTAAPTPAEDLTRAPIQRQLPDVATPPLQDEEEDE